MPEAQIAEKLRPKRGNQYTARRAALDAERAAERWQENPRWSAAALMRRLDDIHNGKVEVTAQQIKALELMLSRVAPTLSAVEQTVHEASRSESEILADIQAFIAQNPAMLTSLLPAGYALVRQDQPIAPQQTPAIEQTSDTPTIN